MKKNKPQYSLYKNGDWSGISYGKALKKYFPNIPKSETFVVGHWYFTFDFHEYHPYLDFYVFHIKKDLANINLENKANFSKGNKPTAKIIVKRILVIKEFTEYCSNNLRDIYKFLFQPVYKNVTLT